MKLIRKIIPKKKNKGDDIKEYSSGKYPLKKLNEYVGKEIKIERDLGTYVQTLEGILRVPPSEEVLCMDVGGGSYTYVHWNRIWPTKSRNKSIILSIRDSFGNEIYGRNVQEIVSQE